MLIGVDDGGDGGGDDDDDHHARLQTLFAPRPTQAFHHRHVRSVIIVGSDIDYGGRPTFRGRRHARPAGRDE